MAKLEEKSARYGLASRYRDEWVLQNLSFTVPKGQIIAIVGPTGAGKSTIVSLLPRLYDLCEGEILIDGKPLTSYTQESLRKNIAFVPQKPLRKNNRICRIASGRMLKMNRLIFLSHYQVFLIKRPCGS